MTPFSAEVVALYIRETVDQVHSAPMCWQARQSEYRSLAFVLAQAWRMRDRDWMPASRAPEDRPGAQ